MPVKTTIAKDSSPLLKALQAFAEELTAKYTVSEAGEPEDQLRPAVDRLFRAYGDACARAGLLLKGEVPLHDRLGQPDFCLYAGPLPIGFVELKAPGKGANPALYKGHDKEQWERFRAVPSCASAAPSSALGAYKVDRPQRKA